MNKSTTLRLSKVKKSFPSAKPSLFIFNAIDNFFQRLPRLQIISGINVDFLSHTIYGILGPNGAGKTTLLKVLAQFLHQDSGSIYFLSTKINKNGSKFRRNSITYWIPLDPMLTPIETIQWYSKLYGKSWSRKRALTCLKRVNLEKLSHVETHALSSGQKSRLKFAIIFFISPKLIVLDEPFNHIDTEGITKICNQLIKLKERGATIIVTSHNTAPLVYLQAHLLKLNKGKLHAKTSKRIYEVQA